jgi:hypothetical protein
MGNLTSLGPYRIDQFKMNNLNGEINLKQNNSIYQPTSKIDSLK